MSLLPEQAKTLADAIKNLDHSHALRVRELEQYYVSRDDRIIKRLGRPLLRDYPQKFLFTGHRGTGKSTELANFEKRFENDFYIIRYSVEQVLDLYDITHVDVLLSLALEMSKIAHEKDIDFDRAELEKLWSFGKDIETETEETRNRGGELSVGLGGIGAALGSLFDVSARIGSDAAMRHTVRKKVQGRISELHTIIAKLAINIKQATKKPVVCIVEDLDKADIKTAEAIFYGNGKSLAAPDIAIIYTFPAALQHNNNFTQITETFGNSVTLPNFRVLNRQGEHAVGMNSLKELLHARIVPELFSKDATQRLIESSGGIPRILLELARNAALEADIDEVNQVTIKHVRIALKRKRVEFKRMLSHEQLRRLTKIKQDKTIDQTSDYQELLHNLSVYEYDDVEEEDGLWYDINPVVNELLS